MRVVVSQDLKFDAEACGLLGPPSSDGAQSRDDTDGERVRRKYHRKSKLAVPRWWRTRADLFEAVGDEVCELLVSDPDQASKALFRTLQQRHPGQFSDGQIRSLQRRVREWRERTVLVFADPWRDEERLLGRVLPDPLMVEDATTAESVDACG